MKDIKTYTDKNILVLGLGKSGFAVSELLLKLGAKLTLNDKADLDKNEKAQELKARGVRVIGGHHPVDLLEKEHFDYLVKNPGIPNENPMVQEAEELNIPIITEPEIALSCSEAPYVCVTGSNGKTTTKDMVAAVLSKRFNVHKTQANFNNEIGVPMTILEMKPNTEILVLEMGMDRPGQLHHLSELTHPDVAVITMIGEAHIEFFGTRDKIADAKMEITDFLREDGEFIFNGDEPLLQERAKKLDQVKATFGFRDEDTVHATGFKSYMHHATFTINDSEQKFSIPMIGKHNVSNAMAAISVGRHFGESDEEIASSLSNFTPTANRMEWEKGDAGESIMSDIYNSNPTAVRAVLTSFGQVEVKDNGRRIAVLGDMLELGKNSPELHAGLEDTLDPQIINEVYLYGSEMKNLYDALQDKYEPEHLHYYTQEQTDRMIDDLKNDIKSDDIVVLKGSHGMHLENVLARLR